jgi:hypothetical protein
MSQVYTPVMYKAVRAPRGKLIRGEPIAALYEQHRVHHVGTFGVLEDQMCDLVYTIAQRQRVRPQADANRPRGKAMREADLPSSVYARQVPFVALPLSQRF